jgi:hypothetical protein
LDTGEPDPRQDQFRAVLTQMQAESFTPIGMAGFRASCVDLGWLSDEILDYVLTMPDCDPEHLAALIGEELPSVVQRLKSWSVSTAEWPETIELSFETKDDAGTYRYTLSVRLDG